MYYFIILPRSEKALPLKTYRTPVFSFIFAISALKLILLDDPIDCDINFEVSCRRNFVFCPFSKQNFLNTGSNFSDKFDGCIKNVVVLGRMTTHFKPIN